MQHCSNCGEPLTPPEEQTEYDARLRALAEKLGDRFLNEVADQLTYLWAQDGLLELSQQDCEKLRAELVEVHRPLEDQMRRLNDRVVALNREVATLRAKLVEQGPKRKRKPRSC